MPFAAIDDKGDVLEYEDSGVPNQSTDYTTVFFINLYLFHGGIFRPMFPYAAPHNLRVIAIHQRAYRGSTPFTEDELDVITFSGDEEEEEDMLRRQGVEFAHAIADIIRQESLPPVRESNGVRSGGVVIVGWTGGITKPLGLLGHLDALEKSLYALLEQYINAIVFHCPPCSLFGTEEPAGAPHPMRGMMVSPEEAQTAFTTWLSSYFEPITDLQSVTSETILKRKNLSETSSDPCYARTQFSPAELAELTCPDVAARFGPVFARWQVAREVTRRAFVDTKGMWKDVRIILTWADMGVWTVLWAAKGIAEILADPAREGEQRREVRFVRLENANVWYHYTQPERMLQVLVDNIR